MKELLKKYNVPAPRYTSYPTVPYWEEASFSVPDYIESIRRSFNESNEQEGISLYIHLPYCESLCTFCGCNKRITLNHDLEGPYIKTLLEEWAIYKRIFGKKPTIREIHLGGGTPTFFSPANLEKLIMGIVEEAVLADHYEFGLEGHPNNTTYEHLKVLGSMGFSRVSFGVQDNDPVVQKAINRIQPIERVEKVTEWARTLSYQSVNFDLVYGLPFQKLSSITNTIEHTLSLLPDRLAFYSYAHVPWIKGIGQRKFTEQDLPPEDEKRHFYETGRKLLEAGGYTEIGMDHFSLESDSLYHSMKKGNLHRNFMGYSSNKTQLMIGLGVSSIGDSWYGFGQNLKKVEDYISSVGKGELPVFRGHLLNEEDRYLRRKVLDVMCFGKVNLAEPEWKNIQEEIMLRLEGLRQDGLIEVRGKEILVTTLGRAFLRNICMAFDARLWRRSPGYEMFSKAI